MALRLIIIIIIITCVFHVDDPETFDIRIPDIAVTDADMTAKHDRQYHDFVKNMETMHESVLSILPEWKKAATQDPASWHEQNECLDALTDRAAVVVDAARHMDDVPMVRPVYISGPPGCGKTFVALQLAKFINEQSQTHARYVVMLRIVAFAGVTNALQGARAFLAPANKCAARAFLLHVPMGVNTHGYCSASPCDAGAHGRSHP